MARSGLADSVSPSTGAYATGTQSALKRKGTRFVALPAPGQAAPEEAQLIKRQAA